ncbi:hypothetical protein XENORESO_013426 [Xenotaenia resolanae]|uniref:Uncharacterized protein n=1 Tax=Xenotaenia resolanae TaxID=208358 RepID=A0ABV0X9A6_9TELE
MFLASSNSFIKALVASLSLGTCKPFNKVVVDCCRLSTVLLISSFAQFTLFITSETVTFEDEYIWATKDAAQLLRSTQFSDCGVATMSTLTFGVSKLSGML